MPEPRPNLTFRIDVHHHHHAPDDVSLAAAIQTLGEEMAKQFKEQIEKVRASLDESFQKAVGRVQDDIAKMQAKIDKLTEDLDTDDPEAVAALQSLEAEMKAKMDALDPFKDDVLPTEPTEPTEPPATEPPAEPPPPPTDPVPSEEV